MDEIDLKIMAILSADARASATEIAKMVHRSRVTVQNRISTLIAQGEIKAFGVVLKSKALPVIFEVSLKSNGSCDLIVPRFRQKYPITKAWSVTGNTDLFIWTQADKSFEIHAMRNFLLQQQEIVKVATHAIINTYH